jgi:hypothetical protein
LCSDWLTEIPEFNSLRNVELKILVIFAVFTAVTMKSVATLDMPPCSVV